MFRILVLDWLRSSHDLPGGDRPYGLVPWWWVTDAPRFKEEGGSLVYAGGLQIETPHNAGCNKHN